MPNFESSLDHVKAVVDTLGHDLQPSILIGGWASWIRLKTAMSADIDTIIGSDAVRSKLQQKIPDLSSNTVHQGRKLRGTIEGIHIDIYLPYESRLGQRLQLKTEVLARFLAPGDYQGWLLLTPEAHLVTKIAALLDRPRSAKGQKDADEIVALLKLNLPAETCVAVLRQSSAEPLEAISEHIDTAFAYLADLTGRSKADRQFLASVHQNWRAALELPDDDGDAH